MGPFRRPAIVVQAMSSIIYGHILCDDSVPDSLQHNSQVLERLPEAGVYVVRKMFSLLPYSKAHAYYGTLIHFAAYYKEFWILDDDWITEYESLLSQLFWSSSQLIHTYSGQRFTWSPGSPEEEGAQRWKVSSRQTFASYHDLPLEISPRV